MARDWRQMSWEMRPGLAFPGACGGRSTWSRRAAPRRAKQWSCRTVHPVGASALELGGVQLKSSRCLISKIQCETIQTHESRKKIHNR